MELTESVSLTEAARRLRLNKAELRGVLKGMKIRLPEFGRAKVVSAANLEKIERHLASLKTKAKSS